MEDGAEGGDGDAAEVEGFHFAQAYERAEKPTDERHKEDFEPMR